MNALVVFGENKLAIERVTFKQKLTNSADNTVNTVNTISSLKRSSNVLVPEVWIGAFTINFEGQFMYFL